MQQTGRRRPKAYGKKASVQSTAVKQIFTSSADSSPFREPQISLPKSDRTSNGRSALADITTALNALGLETSGIDQIDDTGSRRTSPRRKASKIEDITAAMDGLGLETSGIELVEDTGSRRTSPRRKAKKVETIEVVEALDVNSSNTIEVKTQASPRRKSPRRKVIAQPVELPKAITPSPPTSVDVSDLDLSNLNIGDDTQASIRSIFTASPRKPRTLEQTSLPKPPEWLCPLYTAYQNSRHEPLIPKTWSDILDSDSTISKIAEASYAEVYRVNNPAGSSILKIMALRPPKGPGSRRETAIKVEDVMSEMEIMDLLTEIPGFVEFKDAHLITGTPSKPLVEAYEKFEEEKEESAFPRPASYAKSTQWICLELADAGTVLENFEIANMDQLWDIFLGVVIAFANAETECRFEHRDLHENNICIKAVHPPSSKPRKCAERKFGYSGLQVTLLDYTLSRADKPALVTAAATESEEESEQEPEIAAMDLEQDLSLFHATADAGDLASLQFDTYRRMRTLLVTGKNVASKSKQHEEAVEGNPWRAYIPETNVMWLHYVLQWLLANYAGEEEDLNGFWTAEGVCGLVQGVDASTVEKKRKKGRKGARAEEVFKSAGEVLEYAIEMGWVRMEDVVDYAGSGEVQAEEDSSVDLAEELGKRLKVH